MHAHLNEILNEHEAQGKGVIGKLIDLTESCKKKKKKSILERETGIR